MKALSIHPYYAMSIIAGVKTVESRTWRTDYRGDILICSTATKLKGTIPGHALGIVTLADVVPFTKKHLEDAQMVAADMQNGLYAWILENPRLIKPIPVKGKLSLWNFEDESKIEILPWLDDEEEADNQFNETWKPLII